MSTKTKFNIPPKSRFRRLRLDPEIVDLIIELNKAGFATYGSCAGHSSYSGKGMMRGYISFEGYNDKEGIMKILEAYGLRNIRIEHRMDASDGYRGAWLVLMRLVSLSLTVMMFLTSLIVRDSYRFFEAVT